LVQRNENWNPYSSLHYIIMDREPRLAIHCRKVITTKSHIVSSPHCCLGCFHNLLMHEFCHYPTRVINLKFFVIFWIPRTQTKPSLPYTLAWDILVAMNARLCQIANLPCFLFCLPICKLVNNTFTVERSKQFLVFSMSKNFGIIPIPFFHIISNILVNFFATCMFIKRISLKSK
jgi:hypothetical protein